MAIGVIQSSSIEILLEALKRQIHQKSNNTLSIFEKQHFVVPNKSIEKWLTNELSKRDGVVANFVFFSRIQSFQWDAYKNIIQDKDLVRQASMPRIIVKWRIYQALKPFILNPSIEITVDHDLYGLISSIYENTKAISDPVESLGKRKRMLYWVAENTAKLISNYIEYRGSCDKHNHGCTCPTNWLAKWSKNQPIDIEFLLNKKTPGLDAINLQKAQVIESWQRWLWVNVFNEEYQLFQKVDDEFWSLIKDKECGPDFIKQLPTSLVVFTLLELPPSQLNFLRKVGQYIDVVIYHYNPSQEYWADSVDPRWKNQIDLRIKERFVEQSKKEGFDPSDSDIEAFFKQYTLNFDAELRESRHPLLTRLGKQARDTFSLLSNLSSGEEGAWFDLFFDEEKETLLGKLQSDVLHLLEPKAGSYALNDQDKSIQINVCHSSLRQLEVLKEQLIHWLSQGTANNPRNPEDILVLTPNIKGSEPTIRSVFSPVPKANGTTDVYLPIKITGVPQINLTNAWKSALGRITLTTGRFQFDEFADWLALSATHKLYGLGFKEVERLINLLKQAKFKRGLNEDHLSGFLDTGDDDYRFTLKYAIDRLTMGVAVNEHVYHDDVLSFDSVQVGDFELIGKLTLIYDDIVERMSWLKTDENVYNPEQWLEIIMNDINQYLRAGETNLENVLTVTQDLKRTLSLNRFRDYAQSKTHSNLIRFHIPLDYILEEISKGIEVKLEAAEPSGHITFAQIGYIRPIPYKLVVMLNMDSGIFPDQIRQTPFDLMGMLRTKIGDRSRLDDEQGSFLDALLLAKDGFWVFYNGFDVNGGHRRQPSLVVSELLEHLGLITRSLDVELNDYEDFKGVEIISHLKGLYKVHTLQPYEISGFDGLSPRFKNHWFKVGNIIQQTIEVGEGWSSGEYKHSSSEIKATLLASKWISDMVFPAELYLNSIGVRNITPLDIVPDNEPLVLNGLERYSVRNYLLNTETEDQKLLADRLPVGKLMQSAWELSCAEQRIVSDRLRNYSDKPTDTKSVVLFVDDHLDLNIVVPSDDSNMEWVCMRPSASYAEHRAKAWLQYLLWISHLNLGGGGSDARMIVVFNDCTVEQTGVSSDQAKSMLAHWVLAWKYGKAQPLVLPAKLMLSALESGKALKWSFNEETNSHDFLSMDTILKEWGATYENNPDFPLSENRSCRKHRDWMFILRDRDYNQILRDCCKSFSYQLYEPIYRYQTTIKD